MNETKIKYRLIIIWQKFSWYVGYFLWKMALGYKVTLPSAAAATTKPLLIVANHQGVADPWPLTLTLPRSWFWKMAPVRFMATQYFRNPLMNIIRPLVIWPFVYWPNGVIYLPHPKKKGNEKLTIEEKTKTTIEAITAGNTVVMFPEGRISDNGDIGEFKRGPAYIQKLTGAPILIAALNREKRTVIWEKETIMIPKELDESQAAAWLRNRVLALYEN
jgi:1-acyl-sn-glycerol-3-phosphate acyltransferase